MRPTAPARPGRRLRVASCMVAFIACALLSMGCLSLNFGARSPKEDDPSVLSQTGSVPVAKGQEVTVYYPKPYGSPPNLQTDDSVHGYQIVEQKADCFRVRNDNSAWDLKWTARGVPVPTVVPAQATTAVSTSNP
jgi:hypothetical protein